MTTRRQWLALIHCLCAAACTTGLPPPSPAPPSLPDVKRFLDAVAPHLGNFVTALEQAKRLTPDQAELAHSIVRQLQAKVSELDHYSGPDPAIILKDILPAVAMLMGLFPASAPFVPVLIALQALLAAYLANRPVQAPDGQPVPPPAPPANLRQLYQVEPE